MKNTQQNLIATVIDGIKKNTYTKLYADRRKKHPRVYLSFPNTTAKTLDEMFMIRYNKPLKNATNIVKNSLANYLMDQLVKSSNNENDYSNWDADKIKACIKLSWNQYAGCSCPCSPGYIANFSSALPYNLLKYEEFLVKLDVLDLPII
jgi:hypothetical protein